MQKFLNWTKQIAVFKIAHCLKEKMNNSKLNIESANSENKLLDQICEKTASIIGNNITAKRVKNIIDESNSQGYLIHGVKHERLVPHVI